MYFRCQDEFKIAKTEIFFLDIELGHLLYLMVPGKEHYFQVKHIALNGRNSQWILRNTISRRVECLRTKENKCF